MSPGLPAPLRALAESLTQSRWPALLAFLLALAAASPWLRPLPAPRFIVPESPPSLPHRGTSEPRAQLLPNPAESAHSVSLAELGSGSIAAVWFAGSREGAADVSIHFSTFDGANWTNPQAIVLRKRVQQDSSRLVRKLGNPVLWRDPAGILHLWFVSVGFGGWAGSAINHSRSTDGGLTLSAATRLVTSPFWNLSTLVHGAPVALMDGGIALPVYHEFIAKRPEWLRLDGKGDPVDKQRLPDAARSLQPAVAALDGNRALALLRDASSSHRVRMTRSNDGGAHWTAAAATELPNPDAGIALLRLHDGRLLLAYNPQEAKRTRLALAISGDEGQSWSPPRLIEQGDGEDEFSYPALLQGRNGTIHLAYTWQRQKIKHLSFTPAWLKGLH